MDNRDDIVATPSAHATYLPKEGRSLAFPLDKTVLLIIDPVNDFLSEGGAAWEMTKTTVKLHDVIDNMRRAIDGARAVGVPVIFGPMAYTEEDYADQQLHHRCGINRLMFERKMFIAGSWGADFHPDLKPLADEVVLLPHKSTDVFETDLPEHLARLETTHLVIAGMTANLCCESTGRRATEKGLDVTFLKDAIGSEDLLSYEAAVRINYPLIGNAVFSVDDLLASFGSSQGPGVPIQVGDMVCGSDGGEIGKITHLTEPTAGSSGYALVQRGLIFDTDTYIPLDAFIKQAGNKAFINLPKMVVGKMNWETPPTAVATQAKFGQPAARVDQLYGSRNPTGLN